MLQKEHGRLKRFVIKKVFSSCLPEQIIDVAATAKIWLNPKIS